MTESRILIADDEPYTRQNLRESLEEAGYLVVGEADNGISTVHMARQLRPDVVMTDIRMPQMDGLEVARLLHQERLSPVILTTSHSNREIARAASSAGVLAYLLKPIQSSDLMPTIEVVRARWNDQIHRHHELLDLREQLETRTVIERAKGYLMDNQGLREAEAFRKIQRLAMNNRRTMKEVAQAILLAQQIHP